MYARIEALSLEDRNGYLGLQGRMFSERILVAWILDVYAFGFRGPESCPIQPPWISAATVVLLTMKKCSAV